MVPITVLLHDAGCSPRRVCVDDRDPVHVLERSIAGGGRRLIVFGKAVLMTGFTFHYHGIKNNDHLYVVRPVTRPDGAQKCSHSDLCVLGDPRCFPTVAVRLAVVREAARLSDVSYCRSPIDEARRMIDPAMTTKTESASEPMIISETPPEPNSEALPYFGRWKPNLLRE
jgi:hypothetical protein